jgi:hypothetical protein
MDNLLFQFRQNRSEYLTHFMAVLCVVQKAGQPFFAHLWSDFDITIREETCCWDDDIHVVKVQFCGLAGKSQLATMISTSCWEVEVQFLHAAVQFSDL